MFGFKITQKEIQERIDFYKNLRKAPINLPKKLLNPHYITQNTKKYIVDEERFWRDKKTIYISYRGTKEFVHRVLSLTEFLVRFLEFRGYIFKIDRNGEIYCAIKGIEIYFNFRQAMKRVLDTSTSYKSYKEEETDNLVFQMYKRSYNRKEWRDTPKVKLEEKILHIIAYTELYCEYELEEIKKRDAYHKQMEIERQKEEEVKRLKQLENEKLDQLIDNAEKWDQTEKILNYLTKRKQTLIENDLFNNKEKEYYEWGLQAIENIKNDLLTSRIKN